MIACSSVSKKSQVDTLPQQQDAIPDSLTISFGSGGGFTGNWEGYSIYSSGKIEEWKGRWFLDKPSTRENVLTKEDVAHIWDMVEASDFFTTTYNETGNFTAILKVTHPGFEKTAKWMPSSPEVESPKHPTDSLFHALTNFLTTTPTTLNN